MLGTKVESAPGLPLSAAECMQDDFFGFACVCMTPPPNLFHPVLVQMDKESGKCTASLKPIIEGWFFTEEIKLALRMGYRLDAIHRFDKYHRGNIWRNFIQDLVILKMSCERPTPSVDEQQRIANAHEALGMKDKLIASFPSWSPQPAKKQGAKTTVNAVWGKFCQRPSLPTSTLINEGDTEIFTSMMNNIATENVDVMHFNQMGSRLFIKVHQVYAANKRYYTHRDSYLPMAVAVPAYGRMVLYEQLAQLGQRVLYHDTDSIIYIWQPDAYNIPVSDTLGEWEVEKCDSKHGGLRAFVGVGPKSYGIRGMQPCSPACGCDIHSADQYYTAIKVKGLSIKHSHRNMLNFDIFAEIVRRYVEEGTLAGPLHIPQYTFNYQMGQGIFTRYYTKRFAFQPELLKGKLYAGVVYPDGYCEGCMRDLLGQDDHACLQHRINDDDDDDDEDE